MPITGTANFLKVSVLLYDKKVTGVKIYDSRLK